MMRRLINDLGPRARGILSAVEGEIAQALEKPGERGMYLVSANESAAVWIAALLKRYNVQRALSKPAALFVHYDLEGRQFCASAAPAEQQINWALQLKESAFYGIYAIRKNDSSILRSAVSKLGTANRASLIVSYSATATITMANGSALHLL